jgi:hypothetical protein
VTESKQCVKRIVAVASFAAALFLSCPPGGLAQERLTPQQVEQDVRYFIRTLEETHPDPYTAFGGKVEFKRRVGEMLRSVPADGLEAAGVYELMAPFLADLGDGHTRLSEPSRTGDDVVSKWLPIRFAVASDAIFVSQAGTGFEALVGYRLVAAEGLAVEHLTERAARITPTENAYGHARTLAAAVRSNRYSARLFGWQRDTAQLVLESPDGVQVRRLVPFLDRRELAGLEWSGGTRLDLGEGNGPIWWTYLEQERVGYLRLLAIEGAEAFREARGRQDLPGYVSRYYSRYLDHEAPADLDSALAGVPCFTQTVTDLLSRMRADGGEYLIVDVRHNGGGWSSLMLPLYLLAFGNEYLDYPFPDLWVDVASPQLLQLNNWTEDDLASQWGPAYGVGDYRFDAVGSPRGDRSLAEYADGLGEYGCGMAEVFERQAGEPLYRPTVIVLVDAGTFSAAYHAAYVLWRLGAVVVGVPPAQAGNAYTNVVPIELPNAGLRGSVARSAQVLFPHDEALGRVLEPDFPMRWSDYAHYEFDRNSEILRALRLIAEGRIQRRRARRPTPGGSPP